MDTERMQMKSSSLMHRRCYPGDFFKLGSIHLYRIIWHAYTGRPLERERERERELQRARGARSRIAADEFAFSSLKHFAKRVARYYS